MKTYNVTCPICGKMNRGLYLEETDGWMECEQCQNDIKVQLIYHKKLKRYNDGMAEVKQTA